MNTYPRVPIRLVSSRTPHTPHAGMHPPTPPKNKNKGMGVVWKGALVVLFATFITTLAIKASDTFTLPGENLANLGSGEEAKIRCGEDMVYVPTANGGFCIDRYENSPGKNCEEKVTTNQFVTNSNMTNAYCVPGSTKGSEPWVNVTLHQAMDLCARAGKRLPTPGEWYRAALGTPEVVAKNSEDCALGMLGTQVAEATGIRARCVSSYGAYDMVGNVWEWVDASVVDGRYNDRSLPDEGYVSEADSDGVAVMTSNTPSEVFHHDYFFVDKNGVRGMFEGGFWNMGDKAGTFAVNAANPTTFVGGAVGFRCVK